MKTSQQVQDLESGQVVRQRQQQQQLLHLHQVASHIGILHHPTRSAHNFAKVLDFIISQNRKFSKTVHALSILVACDVVRGLIGESKSSKSRADHVILRHVQRR